MDHDRLVTLFRYWGDVEAMANLSPLYAIFGHAVADDPELLVMAAEALPDQPPPNVLFAAVHAFLARHPDEPLSVYYASLGGSKPADSHAATLLKELCLRNREELLPVIRARLVQTNEVRRSAVLLPAFASITRDAGEAPLALIEIGPSAGLNLNFDHYQYHYDDLVLGNADSGVNLDCEIRGARPEVGIPKICSRRGIDINPLDVNNESDVAWLRALLWPEHTDRLRIMNAAIEVARRHPPNLMKGDVFEQLPESVRSAPPDATVCIFATFVLNQFPEEMLARLKHLLFELSRERSLYLVVMGFSQFIEPGTPRGGDTKVWIVRFNGGEAHYQLSSLANPHGRWLDWKPDSPWTPWLRPIQDS